MIPLRDRGARTIADFWNGSVPARYRIDESLVAQNLLAHPLLHEEASGWFDDGFVAIKRSAADLYDGPDRSVAHLSLLSGPLYEETLGRIERILLEGGYQTLVVGMDSGHFLPGAPTDVPWLGSSLRRLGFEAGGLAFDLERRLGELTPEALPSGFSARRATADDANSMEVFFRREFPGRWRYDVLRKIEAEGPNCVFGLFQGEECLGFALLQDDGAKMPIGGAVWRKSLGADWGSLGPIGIAASIRNGGVGKVFLNAALVELQKGGTAQTIIDWTTLIDFYGTQGFAVTRAYRSYRLNLRADRRSVT